MKTKQVMVGSVALGGEAPLALIAGPCVLETEAKALEIARYLKTLAGALEIGLIFKASYDKANRTSLGGFRGPGLKEGLEILAAVKRECDVPVLTDVHRFEEIGPAAAVADVLQVPAFLCRQTDFVMEVARRAGVINLKKGQFLAPSDCAPMVEKARAAGNERIILTERGTSFGYHNLVADFRALPILRSLGYPVVFDATHSVQLPGGSGNASGGDRDMVPYLCRAAVAAGVDGLFLEVYPDPSQARCDGPNSLALDTLPGLLKTLIAIDRLVRETF